jgi:hypothetical protein
MTTQATEASIVGGKRKKSVSGVAIEDDLPDHLHYHGNPPKEHCAHPGIYSTSVIPFTSRQWNYNHWIHRTNENNHCCIKCQQKIATGGNDDFSNSVKHVILNHPEISAWQDVVKHSSIAINQFKLMLERNFEPKAPTLTSTSGGATKSNSLGFSVTGSTKKDKKIAIQDMLVRAIALGFLPLNFSKNLGGKIILEWGNGGTLPEGVSPTALSRRMQTYHAKKVLELSKLLTCFKHNDTDERPATLSDDEYTTDRLLCLQQDIWSNAAQVVLLA